MRPEVYWSLVQRRKKTWTGLIRKVPMQLDAVLRVLIFEFCPRPHGRFGAVAKTRNKRLEMKCVVKNPFSALCVSNELLTRISCVEDEGKAVKLDEISRMANTSRVKSSKHTRGSSVHKTENSAQATEEPVREASHSHALNIDARTLE